MAGTDLINPFPNCWGCGGPNEDAARADGHFFVYCARCRGGQDDDRIHIRHNFPPTPHGHLTPVPEVRMCVEVDVRGGFSASPWQPLSAFTDADLDELLRVNRARNPGARVWLEYRNVVDQEWPSVVYANPADFFDDNHVIDA